MWVGKKERSLIRQEIQSTKKATNILDERSKDKKVFESFTNRKFFV